MVEFFKGIVIGMGAIAPECHGGTLAVILGIYEKITKAIANLFHDFWKKVGVFPLALGGSRSISSAILSIICLITASWK